MAYITKEHAVKIARKLRADIDERTGRAHDLARVYHEDKLVASFGIRRASGKNLGHDHVPAQLYVRPHQAKLLAQCPLTRAGWIDILRGKGMI